MLKQAILFAIRGYKRFLSPLLPPACRYLPTCSAYAAEAVQIHGVITGGWLATRRICRCHPWGGQGWDPVPGSPDDHPSSLTGGVENREGRGGGSGSA